jgi:hypothetical protein
MIQMSYKGSRVMLGLAMSPSMVESRTSSVLLSDSCCHRSRARRDTTKE